MASLCHAGFQLHSSDVDIPEQPYETENLRPPWHQGVSQRPQPMLQWEAEAQIQNIVREEVLKSSCALWARIEELERRITDSRESRPHCGEFQNEHGCYDADAVHPEERSGRRDANDLNLNDGIGTELERLAMLPPGGLSNSTEVYDHAKRLDAVDGVPMREDENVACQADFLAQRLQHLEVELENIKEEIKNAIKSELKAQFLLEFPQLDNKCLIGDGGPAQACRPSFQKIGLAGSRFGVRSRLRHKTVNFRQALSISSHEQYVFQNNVWDLALFIGLPELGLLGSLCSTLLLLANLFLQVGMLVIINEVFTLPSVDEDNVSAMRHWRFLFGQSFDFADKNTFESLSSRVCRMDLTLPYSEGVLLQIVRISEYMPAPEDYDSNSKNLPFGHLVPHFETIGVMLCVLAIVIWLLKIVSTCNDQWQLAVALNSLPTRSGDCVLPDREGSMRLASLSATRKAWSVVLITCQFLVALPLAAMGVCFMIATTDMRDLLLNCSALAIVLDCDELFYAALAPSSGKILIRSLSPLPRRAKKTVLGLNGEPVFFSACIVSIVAFAVVRLAELLQIMRDIRQEICGGNRNFLVVRDNAGVIHAGAAGSVMDDERLQSTYAFEATMQLIEDEAAVAKFFAAPGSMSVAVSGMISSVWSLQSAQRRNVVDVMEYLNMWCMDMLPTTVHRYSPYFLHILRDDALNSTIDDCNDVRTFCSGDGILGTRTRQFCPVTCGCTNRSSSLAIEGVIGCPPACAQSRDYNASMWSKACVDERLSSAYWSRFISGLRSLQASYPANSSWVNDFDASIQTLQDHGCKVITGKLSLSFVGAVWTDPCITSPAKVKSLIYACPVSCECHTKYRSGCPLSCRSAATGDLE